MNMQLFRKRDIGGVPIDGRLWAGWFLLLALFAGSAEAGLAAPPPTFEPDSPDVTLAPGETLTVTITTGNPYQNITNVYWYEGGGTADWSNQSATAMLTVPQDAQDGSTINDKIVVEYEYCNPEYQYGSSYEDGESAFLDGESGYLSEISSCVPAEVPAYNYVSVTVSNPVQVSPNSASIAGAPGSTHTISLQVSGGTPPYSVSSTSGASVALSGSTLSYTIPANATADYTDKVRVEDSVGSECNCEVSISVSVTLPPPPNLAVESGTGQSVTLGQALQPFVVKATVNGTAAAEVPIVWTLVSGNGTLSTTQGLTDAQGRAASTLTPNGEGDFVVSARIDGTETQVQFAAKVTSPPTPSLMMESGTGQVVMSGQALQPFVVKASANGVAAADVPILWTLVSGNGTLSTEQGLTDANGRASSTLTPSGEGDFVVSAQIEGDSATVRFNAEVTATPTPSLAVESGSDQVVTAGEALQPFVAKATVNGAAAAKVPVLWTLISGNGTLSTMRTLTDAQGRASSTLTPNGDGDYVVSAQIEGSDSKAQFTARVNAAPVPSLAMESGNGQIVSPGQTLQPFVVQAALNGDAAAQVPILWTLVSGTGTLSTERTLTDAQGRAASTLTPEGDGDFVVDARIDGTDETVRFTSSVAALASLAGLTGPQLAIATTLDELCPRLEAIARTRPLSAGEQDLLVQCRTLIRGSVTNPGAAAQGVAAITPGQASAPRWLTRRVIRTHLDHVARRQFDLRRGAEGLDLQKLSFSAGDQRVSGSALSQLFAGSGETGGGASADTLNDFERLGIFVSGNIDWGSKDNTSNEDGFDFDTLGLTAGIDYKFSEGLVLGLALGYGDTSADIDSNGGTVAIKAWSGSLYGTYYASDRFYLEGSATYGWNDYDQTRNISSSLLGSAREANANFGGDQYALMFGAGYDFILKRHIIDLYGRVSYVNATLDGYRESGALGLDLDIRAQQATSFTSTLGANYTGSISLKNVVLVPQGWLEWVHEFESGDESVRGAFANDPSSIPFALATDSLDTDYLRIGAGIGAQFGKGRTLFLTYEAAIGVNNYTEHAANLGARLDF